MNSQKSEQNILTNVSSDMALFLQKMKEMGERRDIPNISWDTA
jgi:hypothetical protein